MSRTYVIMEWKSVQANVEMGSSSCLDCQISDSSPYMPNVMGPDEPLRSLHTASPTPGPSERHPPQGLSPISYRYYQVRLIHL